MEHLEGEQYSQYPVDRNLRAYMPMREYRHLPWQNQQPVERNQNPSRSMRDYRNPPWMSAPFCSVSPTNAPLGSTYKPSWGNHLNHSCEQCAPPASSQYTSSPQPQPPQPTSPVEQAILNLTKLVGDVTEDIQCPIKAKNSYCGELSEPEIRWASK